MNRTLQFQRGSFPSIGPKVLVTCLQLLGLTSAVWMTNSAMAQLVQPANRSRQLVLTTCALVYVVRSTITLFMFVKRRIPWWEAAWGGMGIGFALFLFVREGSRASQPFGFWDLPWILLYISGSYVGSASEYFRHLWKARPENIGHLYTEGLFRYCRHINYSGDLLLFTGFAVLTLQIWTGIVPLIMMLNFILIIIPAHDSYLRTRYGDEFEEYVRRTKKLVPFVY